MNDDNDKIAVLIASGNQGWQLGTPAYNVGF